MKINGIKVGEIGRKYTQHSKNINKSNKSIARDSMSISSEAKQISGIEKKLAEIPDVRREKVDSLKTAIEKGQYKVDSRAIARKILSSQE